MKCGVNKHVGEGVVRVGLGGPGVAAIDLVLPVQSWNWVLDMRGCYATVSELIDAVGFGGRRTEEG